MDILLVHKLETCSYIVGSKLVCNKVAHNELFYKRVQKNSQIQEGTET